MRARGNWRIKQPRFSAGCGPRIANAAGPTPPSASTAVNNLASTGKPIIAWTAKPSSSGCGRGGSVRCGVQPRHRTGWRCVLQPRRLRKPRWPPATGPNPTAGGLPRLATRVRVIDAGRRTRRKTLCQHRSDHLVAGRTGCGAGEGAHLLAGHRPGRPAADRTQREPEEPTPWYTATRPASGRGNVAIIKSGRCTSVATPAAGWASVPREARISSVRAPEHAFDAWPP